jgi:hypothetical protein
MSQQTDLPSLQSLEYIPFLNVSGCIDTELQSKIGVYAIFDRDRNLQFVGYSRDIYLGLIQNLVRQPEKCYWLKVKTIERPSRSILEEIRQAWILENGTTPPGNGEEKVAWDEPIDAKITMTETEKEQYQKTTELEQIKLLKQIARRVEAKILERLKDRGAQIEIRFNPKLKEQGLLDLK